MAHSPFPAKTRLKSSQPGQGHRWVLLGFAKDAAEPRVSLLCDEHSGGDSGYKLSEFTVAARPGFSL